MAKVDKEALKKHHFWIVAACVPLFVLIGVILVWTGAGSAISAGQKAIEESEKGIQAKNPKGQGPIKLLEENKTLVASKKDKLWESNWNEQKQIFTWPTDRDGKLVKFMLDPKDPNYSKDIKKASMLKFGDELPDDNFQFNAFKRPDVYLKAYETEVELTKPTQFNGPWSSILRYVPDWTDKKPASWMLWLALEDLWIQRGMLEPIRDVSSMMAEFKPIVENGPDGKPLPPGLKRSFQSRIWKVDLEVKTSGEVRYLTGKITNLTDRLQLFGLGNMMKLNVYFDNNVVPMDFRIEGEFCEAKKELPITYIPLAHDLSGDTNPTAITKVAQEFDARTVPVKRIEAMAIGKTSNRHVMATLKAPKFAPLTVVAAAPGADGGEGGGAPAMAGGRDGGRGMGAPGGGPEAGGMPGGPGGMGGSAQLAGLDGFFESLKPRYLETTDQVRRVPVAIKIVVDSMYIQDVLTAYSNSKLRFQVAQVLFNRFHGPLPMPQSGSQLIGGPGDSGFGGNDAMFGGGFGSDDSMGAGPRGMPGGMGMGSPGGRGAGMPGGPMTGGQMSSGGGPGGRGMGAGMPGGPMMGGQMSSGGQMMPGGPGGMGMGMGMPGGFGSFNSTGLAESQATAGLVELTIFGVVSLYERFGATDPAATGTTPAEANPAPMGENKPAEEKKDTAKPDPMPMTPMNSEKPMGSPNEKKQ